MSEQSRERILSTVRAICRDDVSQIEPFAGPVKPDWSLQQRIERLKVNLESVRGEVHLVSQSTWSRTLLDIARAKPVQTLLCSGKTDISELLKQTWAENSASDINLEQYDRDIEQFKERIFELDAAVTTVKGAVAENGGLILWPDESEPRLMSLVPSIHFAVLKASTIFSTLSEAMEADAWADNMPANAVMVSGPSKTADIELVLAYGVHGPKELVVLILDDC